MVKIVRVANTDADLIAGAIEILNLTLGDGYVKDEESLLKSACFVAIEECSVIGAGLATMFSAEQVEKLHYSWPDLGDIGNVVGHLEASGVHPAYRGQGVGRKLTLARMAWLQGNPLMRTIIAESWESGTDQCSAPVLRRVGFEPHATIEGFYFGVACPVCGSSCSCSATLYVWSRP